MIIVVDTNILIDFTRDPKNFLWIRLMKYSKVSGIQLILPSVALFEFYSGSEMNSELSRQKATNILSDISVVDITQEIAEIAAALYRTHKTSIGVVDYMLAATAISLDAELVTLNRKHFQMLKGVRLFDVGQLS